MSSRRARRDDARTRPREDARASVSGAGCIDDARARVASSSRRPTTRVRGRRRAVGVTVGTSRRGRRMGAMGSRRGGRRRDAKTCACDSIRFDSIRFDSIAIRRAKAIDAVMRRDETDERAVRDARDARSTRSGTFTMEEFRLNKRGLGVSSQQRLDALTEGRGSEAASVSASASASKSELREEVDEFIMGVADLDFVGVLGTGSGGVVRRARHKRTGEALAVKNIAISFARDDDGWKRIITELRTLHKSTCEYIVRSRGAYFDQGSVSLIMEYMDGGTMSDATKVLGRWEEEDLAATTAMLADGLHYLHTTLNVVHRDIKPINVLLNLRGEAKLSDFGVSGYLIDASKCHSWVGTVTYMSPERIQGDSYEYTADVWSMALTIVECALGRFPYNPPDVSRRFSFWDLLDIVVKDPVPRLRPELQISDEFDNFVALGLNKDPSGRMLARNMIAHPWIFGRDRSDDKRRLAELTARVLATKNASSN